MAALIGVVSAFVALGLVRLIGFFTHLFYYHEITGTLVSPADAHPGPWAVAIPVVRFVAPGPDVAKATPTRPLARA